MIYEQENECHWVYIFKGIYTHSVLKNKEEIYINIWVGWWEGHKRLLHRAA